MLRSRGVKGGERPGDYGDQASSTRKDTSVAEETRPTNPGREATEGESEVLVREVESIQSRAGSKISCWGPCPWGVYRINAPQEILINENVSHQRRPLHPGPLQQERSSPQPVPGGGPVSLSQLLWAPENKTLHCTCLTFLFLQAEQLPAPL